MKLLISDLIHITNIKFSSFLFLDIIMLCLFVILAYFIVDDLCHSIGKHFKPTLDFIVSADKKINISRYAHINRGLRIEMSTIEKWQLKYIERTNIKEYIPFLNIYILISFIIALFLFSFYLVFPVVRNIVTSIVLSGIISSMPIMLLDIFSKQMSEQARRSLYTFISSLKVKSNIKSDILYIFDSVADENEGPLGKYSKQMVTQIKSGLDPQLAMELFRLKVNNPYFNTFMLNITQAYINQGDLLALLTKLEKEAFRLEKAYHDRKIKTLMDRILILGLMSSTLFISISLISSEGTVRNVFVHSSGGQLLLAIASSLFALGIFLQFKITSFEH